MTRKTAYSLVGIGVVLAVGITMVSARLAAKGEKKQALIYELKQLRQAVEVYVMAAKVKPPKLATALDAKFGFNQNVQWTVKRDDQGNPIDPFGNAYIYNLETSWVTSATPGYEKW